MVSLLRPLHGGVGSRIGIGWLQDCVMDSPVCSCRVFQVSGCVRRTTAGAALVGMRQVVVICACLASCSIRIRLAEGYHTRCFRIARLVLHGSRRETKGVLSKAGLPPEENGRTRTRTHLKQLDVCGVHHVVIELRMPYSHRMSPPMELPEVIKMACTTPCGTGMRHKPPQSLTSHASRQTS